VTTGGGLIGRNAEVTLFDSLCDELPRRGATLLIEGDAGIGKTSLVDEFERRATTREMRALRTSGAIPEATVPYAGLHMLLHPLRHRLPQLPAPQRNALEVVLGISSGDIQPALLTGIATLTLLSELSESGPVLVIADDMQWMDSASRSALLIALRRLAQDPVIAALTVRSGFRVGQNAWMTDIILDPLSFVGANALLDRRSDNPTGAARRRLLETARGNPLALVELSATDATGDDATPQPLARRLELAFLDRFDDLTRPSRLTVLAAALADECTLDEALSAVSRIVDAAPERAWATEAAAIGLLQLRRDEVRFRHPLVRSAVSSACSPAERDSMLQALCDTLAEDPGRTVWWRAELARSSDEDLADELDQLASRSAAGGDDLLAVRALRRAAALSADPAVAAERMLRAAESAARSGANAMAAELLQAATSRDADPLVLARAAWQRELLPIDDSALTAGDLLPALAAIDGIRHSGDPDRATAALIHLASIAWDHSTEAQPAAPLIDAVNALELPPDDPRALFLIAVTQPLERGDELLDRILHLPSLDTGDAQVSWQLGYALNMCGEIEVGARLLQRAVDLLSAESDTTLLPHALMGLSWMKILQGRFVDAQADIEQAAGFAVDLDDPHLASATQAAAAWYRSIDGIHPDFQAILEPRPGAPAVQSRIILTTTTVADGMAAFVNGDHQRALATLSRVTDPDRPEFHLMFSVISAPDAAEAAIMLHDRPEAERRASAVDEIARSWHAPVVLATQRYLHMLLAADDHPDEVRADLARERLPMPYLHARAEHLVGTRLRRSRRITEARVHLRTAFEQFRTLGAAKWAERCRDELRATGDRMTGEPASGHHVLTPQELRISELAATGLTNRQIAQQLFLSPRTVGAHLYAAFPKLGVTERGQLPDALRGS